MNIEQLAKISDRLHTLDNHLGVEIIHLSKLKMSVQEALRMVDKELASKQEGALSNIPIEDNTTPKPLVQPDTVVVQKKTATRRKRSKGIKAAVLKVLSETEQGMTARDVVAAIEQQGLLPTPPNKVYVSHMLSQNKDLFEPDPIRGRGHYVLKTEKPVVERTKKPAPKAMTEEEEILRSMNIEPEGDVT